LSFTPFLCHSYINTRRTCTTQSSSSSPSSSSATAAQSSTSSTTSSSTKATTDPLSNTNTTPSSSSSSSSSNDNNTKTESESSSADIPLLSSRARFLFSLSDLAIGGLFGYLFYQTWLYLSDCPEIVELIIDAAKQDELVIEHIGIPFKKRLWTGYATEQSASITLPIKGPKGKVSEYKRETIIILHFLIEHDQLLICLLIPSSSSFSCLFMYD
jgi:hypothetical protein